MAFKPNYRQQRNDRARAKQAKKQEKLERRAEKAAPREPDNQTPGDGEASESAASHPGSLPDGD